MTKKSLSSLVIFIFLFFPLVTFAQVGGGTGVGGGTPDSIVGSGANTSQATSGVVSLDNPLGGTDVSPQVLIGRVIKAILGLVGSLALIMFIYGGFLWMTSAGNEKKVSQGRDILMWSTIGLIIIFSSYALVRFVISDLLGAK